MTKVYVVRHGETEGNVYGRVSGFVDTHHTKRGYAQIDQLTERFKDIHIDAAYASTRDRAIKTAKAAVKGKGIEVQINPRLGECSLGKWDNSTWGELEVRHPDLLNTYFTDFPKWRVRDVENYDDMRARLIGIVRELAAKHDGQTILLASHGHAIRCIHMEVMGIPNEEVSNYGYGGNTAVTLLTVENGSVKMEYMSDDSHLDNKFTDRGLPLKTMPNRAPKFNNQKKRFNVYCDLLNFETDSEFYLKCRKAAFIDCGGKESDFDPEKTLAAAKARAERNLASVLICKSHDINHGILELDTLKDAEHGYGWIDFYYMDEECRGKPAMFHPLGYAIEYYRTVNRTEMRMSLRNATDEKISFYEDVDFDLLSKDGSRAVMGYDLYR